MASQQVNRKRLLIITAGAGCLGLLIAFAVFGAWLFFFRGGAPTPVARATTTPTLIVVRVATPTSAATLTPLPARTPITDFTVHTSKDGFFAIKYPRGWTVNDQETTLATVSFTAPGRTAQGSVKFGAAGNQTAEQALNAYITDTLKVRAPDARVLAQRKNLDGSAEADMEFSNAEMGGRARGLVRVFIQPGGFYFAVMFSAREDQFDSPTAKMFVEGLSIGK
jgi:hypothetical protein